MKNTSIKNLMIAKLSKKEISESTVCNRINTAQFGIAYEYTAKINGVCFQSTSFGAMRVNNEDRLDLLPEQNRYNKNDFIKAILKYFKMPFKPML